VAGDDNAVTDEDAAVIIAVLANDQDVDSTLTVSAASDPANGSVVINADGTVTYTPDANFFGSDSFSYTASDGLLSDTALVTVTVSSVNQAPIAASDSYTLAEDTALTVLAPGLLGNDTDAENDALSAVLGETTSQGTLALNPDGSFSYTPNADFFGADSFTYRAFDGAEHSDFATVTITVTALNDAPGAADDNAGTDEDTPVTIAVLANDSDVEGDELTVASHTDAAHGTLVLNAGGSFTYTPNANYFGPDSFDYTVSDGQGGSDTASVSLTVGPDNDAPSAGDDSASTPEDTTVTIAVLANDGDVEGDELTVASYTDTAHGTLTLNIDGTFSYTPDANYFGADAFSYAASDGQGGFDTASVSLTVGPVNDAPVAVDDALAALEDTPVIYAAVQLLGNDIDVEGDTLTIAAVTSGAGGTAALNPDGTVSFIPDAGFTGTAVFTYVASDGSLASNTATVTVEVAPAGGGGAIDIEKYVKLADDRHHKGNEGVGNGEDPPPPGHDYNQNDGPGTGPGNPGSSTKTKGDHGGYGDDARGDHWGRGHHGDDDGGDCDDDSSGAGSFGLDADTAPGLTATAGQAVTFTYVVTNPGSVAIANVVVLDDNETPGLPGDDFSPNAVLKKGFNVGDVDLDGMLDAGEAWLYTWSTLVTEGQHVNVAEATGTLEGGGTVSDSDAANWFGEENRTASIGNFVWRDSDADGIQDRSERGVEGVIVNLLDASGAVVASDVTDARGFYLFSGLAAGTYTVAVAPANFAAGGALNGWSATLQDQGAKEAKDSDGDPVTHRSAPVVLGAGQKNSEVDFGFRAPGGGDDCGKDRDRDDDGKHGSGGEHRSRERDGHERHRDRGAGVKISWTDDWNCGYGYGAATPLRSAPWISDWQIDGTGNRSRRK
jgi:VCBS repeat-containing protein